MSWKSKKQSVIRSREKVEYRAMVNDACELMWLKNLMRELGFRHPQPMDLKCDNQAAICIAENQIFHEKTKNIDSLGVDNKV